MLSSIKRVIPPVVGDATKSEMKAGIIDQLQKHYHWLKVGLNKLPENEIRQVLPTDKATELIRLIIDDMPRARRISKLDEELRTIRENISLLERQATKDKKMANKIKSLKRKWSIDWKEFSESNSIVDERRLTIAQSMASQGIEYVKREYGKVMNDSKDQVDQIKQLTDNQNLLANISQNIPKLRHMKEAEQQWDRNESEKRRIAMAREKKEKSTITASPRL
jgi:hypothetical protein